MDKNTKDFFESLLKEISEMPIEQLKAAYVPSSNSECSNFLIKGKPLILNLPEFTVNINYNVIFKAEYSTELQKSKVYNSLEYPNNRTPLNTSETFPAVS